MALNKLTEDAIDHNFYVKALQVLCVKRTKWNLTDDNILTWGDDDIQPEGFIKPTLDQIQAKADELKEHYVATTYQRNRAPEYPPIEDYLDAVVKNDQAQIDAYIAACQAVKAKYPKP
jgi:hypothetical protein